MPSYWDILPSNYWRATEETLVPAYAPSVQEAVAQLSAQRTQKPDPLSLAIELAGGPMMGKIPKPGIRAYHGSPYDFDKFDMSRIGTGEGAQTYGHGLYFAENPGVAADYQRRLNYRAPVLVNGVAMNSDSDEISKLLGSAKLRAPAYLSAKEAMQAKGWNFDDAIGLLERKIESAPRHELRDYKEALESLKVLRGEVQIIPPKGRMYEVNINAHPDRFLDWDKPLSGQPRAFEPFAKEAAYQTGKNPE